MTEQAEDIKPAKQAPSYDDIAVVCDDMVSGIKMCLKRLTGDDLSTARLERMIDDASQVKVDVAVMLNAHEDEYNELVETAEGLQTNNGLLMLRVKELEAQLNSAADHTAMLLQSERDAHHRKRTELEKKVQEGVDAAEALMISTKKIGNEKRILAQQLEELTRLEPEKLKIKNAELKRTNAELTKSKAELSEKFNQSQSNITRLMLDLAHAESNATEATADYNDLKYHEKLLNGEAWMDSICMDSPINPQISFFPYIYRWGLGAYESDRNGDQVRNQPHEMLFIYGMDFHFQIRTTLGVELTCKLSEFGRAMYVIPDELEEHIPEGLDAKIQEYHMEQLERLSPGLYARTMWCRSQHISTLDFVPEKLRQGFIDMKLDNLMLVGSASYEEVKAIKGLGVVTFYKIRQAAIELLETFEYEGKTALKPVCDAPHTKPPFSRRVQAGIQDCLKDIKLRMAANESAGNKKNAA